jgi:hypothetical protein
MSVSRRRFDETVMLIQHNVIANFFVHLLFCWLAVSGLPDPRKDHAIVMGKFGKLELMDVSSIMFRFGPQ